MTYTKEDIISQMRETGVVPLFTHENADEAFEVIHIAYMAGIRVFEVTNRRANSFEVFSALVRRSRELPGLMLGIGTVMDGPTTKKFIDVGAHFIISPIMNLEMAKVCHNHKTMWMPGCATLTEIVTAKQNGAEVIKVFPGSVLGPGFVSSIMPVVPDLKLMITGGVEPTRESLSAWFKAGAMCVGLGSQLFSKDILARKDWVALEDRIRTTLAITREVRK
jgi:2-dehydro-3-deoxyphosphogluconate aldolase / (4S)-4-hydroxy-2-oxoglutarate aldolase